MDSIELNEAQKAAVTAPTDRPVKISAGAGTGKTTVLAARYLELLRRGFSVENLLALTFTRKAAAEMRVRIFRALPRPRDIIRADIYTFDAFFYTILTGNAPESGIDRNSRILSGTERRLFIQETLKHTAHHDLPPLSLERIESYREKALRAVETARMNLTAPEEFERDILPRAVPPEFAKLTHRIYSSYEEALNREGHLDFGEVILRCRRLLRDHPGLRERIRRKYRYILLDEVQDTNPAQFLLLSLIADEGMSNVTAVGDDKQSIYGFRGADIGNIREFTGQEYNLKQNYRSAPPILTLAHRLVCQDEYFHRQEESIKLEPTVKDRGASVFFLTAPDVETEAEAAASEIAGLLDSGVKASEIAVICRRKAPLKTFEQVLRKAGIPYRTVGGGYFEREEVKDALALLKLTLTPDDTGAESRLRRRGFSDGVRILQQSAGLPRRLTSLPLWEAVLEALMLSGYPQFAAQTDSPEQSAANLNKLLEMAEDFAAADPSRELEDFIHYLEISIIEDAEEREAETTGGEAVSILTIHQSKGLEWEVVFAVGFSQLRSPRKPDFIFDPETGKLILRKNPLDGSEYEQYEPALKESNIPERSRGEEIRLQYVAVTRAKNRVYISRSAKSKFPAALDNPETFLPKHSYTAKTVDEGFQAPVFKGDSEEGKLALLKSACRNLMEIPPAASDEIVKLSFSSLRDYMRCPKYYYYRRYLNMDEGGGALNSGEGREVIASVLGAVFHRLIALDPRLERDWETVLKEAAEGKISPKLSDEIDRLLYNYKEMGLDKSEILAVEKGFTLRLEGNANQVHFNGVIDRIEKHRDGFRILDFKTGRVKKDGLNDIRLQLSCYGLAAKRGALGKKFQPVLAAAALRRGEIIEVEFQTEAEDVIIAAAEGIAARDFPTREGDYCDRCPCREICPAISTPEE